MTADQNSPTPPLSANAPAEARSRGNHCHLRGNPHGTPSAPAGGASGMAWMGKCLGKYQITGVLGQGGMGVVLKAHDPMIERDVAIKVLADHLAGRRGGAGPLPRRGQGGREAQPPQRRRHLRNLPGGDRRTSWSWSTSPAAASATGWRRTAPCRCSRRRRR